MSDAVMPQAVPDGAPLSAETLANWLAAVRGFSHEVQVELQRVINELDDQLRAAPVAVPMPPPPAPSRNAAVPTGSVVGGSRTEPTPGAPTLPATAVDPSQDRLAELARRLQEKLAQSTA